MKIDEVKERLFKIVRNYASVFRNNIDAGGIVGIKIAFELVHNYRNIVIYTFFVNHRLHLQDNMATTRFSL